MKSACLGNVFLLLPVLGILPSHSVGAEARAGIESSQRFGFDWMPKPFQKNPLLDMNVVTEMTDAGRARPPASPAHPVYYVSALTGLQEEGRTDAGIEAPAREVIADAMRRALAVNGFLPADDKHPGTLLIVFDWGIFNDPPEDGEMKMIRPTIFQLPDPGHRNLLNRAALVGGLDFAQRLKAAVEQEDLLKASGDLMHHLSPLKLMAQRDETTRALFDRVQAELYFVVATAYDGPSVERRQPVRLWRSKLSVDSAGVNLTDTLPALIASGAPYLGRDMSTAVLLHRRAREGRVNLGPTIYLDDPVESTPPPADSNSRSR